MTKPSLLKENNCGLAYGFRGLVHHQGSECGSMHGAGAVAESYILLIESSGCFSSRSGFGS